MKEAVMQEAVVQEKRSDLITGLDFSMLQCVNASWPNS